MTCPRCGVPARYVRVACPDPPYKNTATRVWDCLVAHFAVRCPQCGFDVSPDDASTLLKEFMTSPRGDHIG